MLDSIHKLRLASYSPLFTALTDLTRAFVFARSHASRPASDAIPGLSTGAEEKSEEEREAERKKADKVESRIGEAVLRVLKQAQQPAPAPAPAPEEQQPAPEQQQQEDASGHAEKEEGAAKANECEDVRERIQEALAAVLWATNECLELDEQREQRERDDVTQAKATRAAAEEGNKMQVDEPAPKEETTASTTAKARLALLLKSLVHNGGLSQDEAVVRLETGLLSAAGIVVDARIFDRMVMRTRTTLLYVSCCCLSLFDELTDCGVLAATSSKSTTWREKSQKASAACWSTSLCTWARRTLPRPVCPSSQPHSAASEHGWSTGNSRP